MAIRYLPSPVIEEPIAQSEADRLAAAWLAKLLKADEKEREDRNE